MLTRRMLAVPALVGLLVEVSGAEAAGSDPTEANKALVLEFWRVVIEARDLDAIGRYWSPDLVQHNPMITNGIAGFADRAKVWWEDGVKRPVEPVLRHPPAIVLAEGDMVLLMFKRPTQDPSDATKTYDLFTFDLYRVASGKIVEHWDSVKKQAA